MAAYANGNIFVYLGGEQEVPFDITHAIIDPSVNIVRRWAFEDRGRLISVIFHDGVEIIEEGAFNECVSLRGIKLLGVREIKDEAFRRCYALSDVKFGDKLERIRSGAFNSCISLRSIKLSSLRTVSQLAFSHCEHLTDVEFGVNMERISSNSFYKCPRLRRIAIPLKEDLFPLDAFDRQYNQFDRCDNLTEVDIVRAEEIHRTISSFLFESWKDEMNDVIGHINQELPKCAYGVEKTNAVRQWISSVITRLKHYKAEHRRLLKEHMTILELAVWKAKLCEKEDYSTLKGGAKRAKIDEESSRKDKRITSGADIIIKNVLPFLLG